MLPFWLIPSSPGQIAPIGIALALLAGLGGCGNKQPTQSERVPRPVNVIRLKETNPGRLDRVSGTVSSWKTEQLGFEVAGRVKYVIEPDTAVQGGALNPEEQPTVPRTLLAELDATRYQISVRSAEAEIKSTQGKRQSAVVEAEKVIPAQEKALRAEAKVALSEAKRNEKLRQRGAVTESEFERAEADYQRVAATVESIVAQREAKLADITGLEAQIDQLQAQLEDARRNVADCQLFSPYNGKVAEVHVVAGAYVERGKPIVTVQMMDPMSVEVEVSATDARRLTYRDRIPVFVTLPDGQTQERPSIVYTIDPVADPLTRTFTVTLLLANETIRAPVPEELQGEPIVRTENVWMFLQRPVGGEPVLMIERRAIVNDAQGSYVWKVTNPDITSLLRGRSPVLNVARFPVVPGERSQNFLGIFRLQEVAPGNGKTVQPSLTMTTGRLDFAEGMDPAAWSGGRVLYDRPRWLFLPGDTVSVDFQGRSTTAGLYVPVEAIKEQLGRKSVFVVDLTDQGAVVREQEVQVGESVRTLRRIEALPGETLPVGTQVVAQGALFLSDGETVNVVKEVEIRR